MITSGNNQPEYPSALEMAKNFSKSVVTNVTEAIKGMPVEADSTVVLARENICNVCEFLDKNANRCTKCGCFLSIKMTLLAEKCPLDKW